MSETETPLTGGRITPGVVRVGDTVRRPISSDRSSVHRLLAHLEALGFDGVPRFQGVDPQNREILSFLPGEVPRDLDHFSDAQLVSAAGLLRRFHDATAGFELVRQQNAEVMCHNDWGPSNAVFRDGVPYGIIDFDTVTPGPRLWDLGYSAFAWLDLGSPDYTGEEQVRRLAVFADGYGKPDCSAAQVAVYAVARQTALASWARARGDTEMTEWATAAALWTARNVTEQLLPTGYPLGQGVLGVS
ncbi:phosphotransferase enzyme family protein [Rhizobium terrae]|uniref:phosphotransferase enzyme family protein n=1 Tax=Rhizobium terrae TaxID=2171756 RepID=UPI000E3B5A06|nr:aminoglycoside phosphotransferase family protein [Rhizobium terrae]